MGMTITNTGMAELMQDILSGATHLKLMLFQNLPTVSHAGVIGDITGTGDECTFTGYARQTVTGWTVGYSSANSDAYLNGPAVTFTCSASGTSNTVNGYALLATDPITATDVLIGYQLFSPAYYIQNSGDAITVTPSITMTQGTGS